MSLIPVTNTDPTTTVYDHCYDTYDHNNIYVYDHIDHDDDYGHHVTDTATTIVYDHDDTYDHNHNIYVYDQIDHDDDYGHNVTDTNTTTLHKHTVPQLDTILTDRVPISTPI